MRFRSEASAMPASAPARQLDVVRRVPAVVAEPTGRARDFPGAMIVPIHREGWSITAS
jgi:hypothetical protein